MADLGEDAGTPFEPQQPGRIISDPVEAATWLAREFGLTFEMFDEMSERARAEWATTTEYDPPGFAGLILWGMCVRYLRRLLSGLGWKRDNSGNLARIIHPIGAKSIVVATADENTGKLGPQSPKTNPKGMETVNAALANFGQMELFADPDAERFAAEAAKNLLTYFFLVHLERGRLYREISLPVLANDGERVDSWHLRVLLPPFGEGDEPPRVQAPLPLPGPEPTVIVTRRMG